jgi:hypothetical protein
MIPRSVQSRLSRLEDRITDARFEMQVREAFIEVAPLIYASMHAASVVALVRYGDAKIDEPLSQAYNRAIGKLNSRFRTEIAQFDEPPKVDKRMIADLVSLVGPDIKPWLEEPSPPLSHPSLCPEIIMLLDKEFPGQRDFSRPLARSPVWLLRFTGVERDADILGFRLPNVSRAPKLGREARKDRDRWPLLPQGTIDAGGPCDEHDLYVSTEELMERNIWLGPPPYRPPRV